MQAAQQSINKIVDLLVNPAIYVLFSLGLLIFVYGVVEFLYNLSKGADTKEGKSHMLWGIVGMLIMVSVYGIITLIDSTFDLDISNPDVSRMDNVTAPSTFLGN